jgi:hypothetical protein
MRENIGNDLESHLLGFLDAANLATTARINRRHYLLAKQVAESDVYKNHFYKLLGLDIARIFCADESHIKRFPLQFTQKEFGNNPGLYCLIEQFTRAHTPSASAPLINFSQGIFSWASQSAEKASLAMDNEGLVRIISSSIEQNLLPLEYQKRISRMRRQQHQRDALLVILCIAATLMLPEEWCLLPLIWSYFLYNSIRIKEPDFSSSFQEIQVLASKACRHTQRDQIANLVQHSKLWKEVVVKNSDQIIEIDSSSVLEMEQAEVNTLRVRRLK